MAKVIVVENDDILSLEADAYLALAAPYRQWNSLTDRAIKKRYGELYHDQLVQQVAPGLFNNSGSRVFVKGDASTDHKLIVFVCDKHDKPLADVLYPAFQTLHKIGVKSVAMAVLRTDFTLPVETVHEAEVKLMKTLQEFQEPLEILVVVHNYTEQANRLRELIVKNDS